MRALGVLVALLVGRDLLPSPVTAQQGLPPTGPVDTLLLPGRQDFAHYTTPGACLRAAMAVEAAAHFAGEDTIGLAASLHDTLATATVTTARRCGARFTLTTLATLAPLAPTAPAALLDLMHLALVMGDDTLARAAGDRYVAAMPEPEARRWALYAVDTTYLSAMPVRLAAAEAVAAQLDALGPQAAVQRAKIHATLLLHARLRYDLVRMEREVLAALAADQHLTAADRELWDGGDGAGGDAAAVLFFLELYRNPQEAMARTGARLKAAGYTGWHGEPGAPAPFGLDRGLAQIGKLAPPLHADFWIGGDSRQQVWPVPGHVSVCLTAWLNRPTTNDAAQLQAAVMQEVPRMAKWRRLLAKYQPVLQVTVLVKTRGTVRDGPPLAPAEEAQRLGQFYREELGVPVTVAVQTAPVKQLPDGRRLAGPAPFERDPYYSEWFLLADRTGRILLALPQFELEEAMLDAWLARAVGR